MFKEMFPLKDRVELEATELTDHLYVNNLSNILINLDFLLMYMCYGY